MAMELKTTMETTMETKKTEKRRLRKVFRELTRLGLLDSIKSVVDSGHALDKRTLYYAVKYDQPHILAYGKSKFWYCYSDKTTCHFAAKFGKTKIFTESYKCDSHVTDLDLYRTAAEHGHLEIIKSLKDCKKYYTVDKAMWDQCRSCIDQEAKKKGHLHILDWLQQEAK